MNQKKNYNLYKHPTYGHVYGESIRIPLAQFVWPHLVKPKAPPPPKEGQAAGAPRYELSVLLPKDDIRTAGIMKELKSMTDEMLALFNSKRSAQLGECLLFGKYGDGDTTDLEKYPFNKGCWIMVARNEKPVRAVDAKREAIEPKDIQGGTWGHMVVTPLVTAHGISYKLEAIQLVRDDGIRFGGAQKDAVELFDACSDEVGAAIAASQDTHVTEKPLTQGKDAVLNLL